MPKIIAPVTDWECRAAKSTMGVGAVKGLYLRVWEGAKTFQLRYRISGRVQFKTLGSYPKLSLSQARKDAAKFLEEVEAGSASSNLRLWRLLDMYWEDGEESGRWRTINERMPHVKRYRAMADKYVPKRLLSLPAEKVNPLDLLQSLRKTTAGKAPTRNIVLSELKSAYNWAIDLQLIRCENPAAAAKRINALTMPPKGHLPTMDPERVPDLIQRLFEEPSYGGYAAIFSILTCCRVSVARLAKWKDFDFGRKVWTVPREMMKSKNAAWDWQIPLSSESLYVLGDHMWGEYAFPGGRNDHLSCNGDINDAIKRADASDIRGGGTGFRDPKTGRVATNHGVARTAFKTWATMFAKYQHPCWPDGIVEAAMDHFEPKYNGAYLRQMPVEEMREVLDAWGRFCFSKVKRNGAMPVCRI